MTLVGFFAVIIVFAGLIFFHELGHFLIARLFGIGVQTFSIGFGKKLVTKTWGKTQYCLSLIPLGGYVSLVGEEDTAELPESFTPQESFALRPAWQRLCVVTAGATFNILLAILLYFGVFFFTGKAYLLPIIGSISAESPASATQLQAGDVILQINNRPVGKWSQIQELTQMNAGNVMNIKIFRDSEEISCTLTPIRSTVRTIFGEEKEAWILGITPSNQEGREFYGFFESMEQAFSTAYNTLRLTGLGLIKMLQGTVSSDNVGGPIMIAQVINNSTTHGIVAIVMLAALISINLGFINLLPIPVLDGGHILFLLIEIIAQRPVPLIWRIRLTNVGLALLLMLMVFATYNDVMRLFK